jgi:hypothetical protein
MRHPLGDPDLEEFGFDWVPRLIGGDLGLVATTGLAAPAGWRTYAMPGGRDGAH